MTGTKDYETEQGGVKVILAPRVYLLGKQTVQREELERFLADERVDTYRTSTDLAGDLLVEVGGRLCYMSFAAPRPGGNMAHVRNLIDSRHGSCLEHSVFTLLLAGISRDCTHELVRYRHNSPSQLSGRYVDSSLLGFVAPGVVRSRPQLWARWLHAVRAAKDAYESLAASLEEEFYDAEMASLPPPRPERLPPERLRSARKRAREAARTVLPGACETKVQVTANARGLRHLFEERCNREAAAEMRRLACAMFECLLPEAPACFQGYERVELPDGTFELKTENRKV